MAISLALQGYNTKKSSQPQLERSLPFGMFHVPNDEDNRPEFNFGQDEAEIEQAKGWIEFMKTLKPSLEPKYVHMMSTHHMIKSKPHQPEPDVPMTSTSTAPKFNT